MRIVTLNVNGIRSAQRKGLSRWLARIEPWDVVCLQEIKAGADQVPRPLLAPRKAHGFFLSASRQGYSGVALYAKPMPKVATGFGSTEFDGEGGVIVGAPLQGRVLIVDDVITDGGAKREAIELIRANGASPAGVLIAFDRMERGRGERSAVQELTREFGLPVIAIATLEDLLAFLAERPELKAQAAEVRAYREHYGATA